MKALPKHWTENEIAELGRIYPTEENRILALKFGCSSDVVKNRARRSGYKKDSVWQHNRKVETDRENQKSLQWANNQEFLKRQARQGAQETGQGFQTIEVVPGGRKIIHRMSDVARRSK